MGHTQRIQGNEEGGVMVDFARANRERQSSFKLYEHLDFKGGWAKRRNRSWSYSTWGQYDQCPTKIFFAKIVGIKDPMGPAAARGIRIHKVAEQYVKGEIDELPARGAGSLADFQVDLDELRNSSTAQAEADWTFREDWSRTNWNDWDDAWVRMKLDVLDTPSKGAVYAADYKTGKKRDYTKQQELYGLGGFKAFPNAEVVDFDIWYLDHGKTHDAIVSVQFLKEEEAALEEKWLDRVAPMLNDKEFKPRPHPVPCGWCAFSKHKGGPCEASAAQ